MKIRIYSVFPGVGKTFLYNNSNKLISDSDSSLFSWIKNDLNEKIRNPDFPLNYIDHIKKLLDEDYEYILVSTHKEVIQSLFDSNLSFQIIYPNRKLKEEYLNRYKSRGSEEKFIKSMDDNWDNFISDLECTKGIKYRIEDPHLTLKNILDHSYSRNSISYILT